MFSLLHLCFAPADETAIYRLHHTTCTTCYKDHVDQEAFLTASGKTLVRIFFSSDDSSLLSHKTTTLAIHLNNARLGVISNDILDSLHAFTSDILAKHQKFYDCKASASVLLLALLLTLSSGPLLKHSIHRSPGPPDLVSILSSDEETDVEDSNTLPTHPRGNYNAASVPQVPLSLLPELEGLLLNLSFSAPLNIPITSSLSPRKALPPTVPASDAVPVQPSLPALVLPTKPAIPTLICHLPFSLHPHRLQINYTNNWMEYNPKFTGSRAQKSSSSGSSSHSKRCAIKIRKLKPDIT
ncbi:hypothetical protein C8R45DRAFT_1097466 [Mycena sanguinolenta]|nr:hypothetical protein C8R45DRAFT_1097466 [Mycena sanguinolenta]